MVYLHLTHVAVHSLIEEQSSTTLTCELHCKLGLIGNAENLGLHFDVLVHWLRNGLLFFILTGGVLRLVRRRCSRAVVLEGVRLSWWDTRDFFQVQLSVHSEDHLPVRWLNFKLDPPLLLLS